MLQRKGFTSEAASLDFNSSIADNMSAGTLTSGGSSSTASSAAASSIPFSPSFVFVCQKCRRPIRVEKTKEVTESTMTSVLSALAADGSEKRVSLPQNAPLSGISLKSSSPAPFSAASSSSSNSAPNLSGQDLESLVDALTESFVVLPNSNQSSSAATVNSNALTTKFLPLSSTTLGNNASGAAAEAAKKAHSATNNDKQFATLSRLLEYASSRSEVDHPLCASCVDMLSTEYDRRLKEVEKDRDLYQAQLSALRHEDAANATNNLNNNNRINELEEEKALLNELNSLKSKEKELENRLFSIRNERNSLNEERRLLELEHENISNLETNFWKDWQDYSLKIQLMNEEFTFLSAQVRMQATTLENLKRTNVYDDAFHLSYDGHMATINGFRLGRLQSVTVDWHETNAALGQVVLLVHTLARLINYKFEKYRLIPMGSFSKMAKIDDPSSTYELYGSNDISLGRLFWYRRFDTALTWLLSCVKELQDFASKEDKNYKPKYAIENDIIGDVSIKLQFNNDGKWTKALKYMLVCLKALLVWCSKRAANQQQMTTLLQQAGANTTNNASSA